MPSNGKVAVVTGAGTGVGKSATLHLLSDGYFVILAGRRLEPLQEVVSESGVSGSKAIIYLLILVTRKMLKSFSI
jgi:NADP-dependent 3-hydroxy acid dehydrogenase YdfG